MIPETHVQPQPLQSYLHSIKLKWIKEHNTKESLLSLSITSKKLTPGSVLFSAGPTSTEHISVFIPASN